MNLSLWNLVGYAGALFALAAQAPGRWKTPAVVLALALAYPTAWALTGAFGGLSYTSGLLVWVAFARGMRPASVRLSPGISPLSAGALLVVATCLYATNIGACGPNLYWGVGLDHPAWVNTVLFLVALPSLRPMRDYAAVFPAVLLLSQTGAHDSRNAWDFHLDPWLALFALIVLIRGIRRRFAKDVGKPAH